MYKIVKHVFLLSVFLPVKHHITMKQIQISLKHTCTYVTTIQKSNKKLRLIFWLEEASYSNTSLAGVSMYTPVIEIC